jgi:hypothetical protein
MAWLVVLSHTTSRAVRGPVNICWPSRHSSMPWEGCSAVHRSGVYGVDRVAVDTAMCRSTPDAAEMGSGASGS